MCISWTEYLISLMHCVTMKIIEDSICNIRYQCIYYVFQFQLNIWFSLCILDERQ